MSETGTKRYAEKKHQLVVFKGSKCHDCGNSFPDCCYDFDHRDPNEKSFTIGVKMWLPIEDLMAEANKCDLVCANCHRIRTVGNPTIAAKQSAAQKANGGYLHSRKTKMKLSTIAKLQARDKNSGRFNNKQIAA